MTCPSKKKSHCTRDFHKAEKKGCPHPKTDACVPAPKCTRDEEAHGHGGCTRKKSGCTR